MALFVRQDEQRSELQNRLAEELRAKAKERAELASRPDGVDDSNYIKDTKTTTSLAWIWILIVIAVIGIAVWLMLIGIDYR
jgi:type VI protein secretion system component VasF